MFVNETMVLGALIAFLLSLRFCGACANLKYVLKIAFVLALLANTPWTFLGLIGLGTVALGYYTSKALELRKMDGAALFWTVQGGVGYALLGVSILASLSPQAFGVSCSNTRWICLSVAALCGGVAFGPALFSLNALKNRFPRTSRLTVTHQIYIFLGLMAGMSVLGGFVQSVLWTLVLNGLGMAYGAFVARLLPYNFSTHHAFLGLVFGGWGTAVLGFALMSPLVVCFGSIAGTLGLLTVKKTVALDALYDALEGSEHAQPTPTPEFCLAESR